MENKPIVVIVQAAAPDPVWGCIGRGILFCIAWWGLSSIVIGLCLLLNGVG